VATSPISAPCAEQAEAKSHQTFKLWRLHGAMPSFDNGANCWNRHDEQIRSMTNYNARYLSDSELKALPFASIGRGVLLDATVQIIGIENISIGSNVRIDAGVSIIAPFRPVRIGSFVHIGSQCYLGGNAGIELHDFVGLSQGVRLYSASDDYTGASLTNPTIPKEFLHITAGSVILGRHVIVGSGTVVLPSVTIAEGCAVGALSLVTRSTDPWGVYAGAPAARKRDRKKDLLQAEASLLQKFKLKSD
jgi:acetyltransferase-like isoleucine patch superfamily enzyme